MQLLRGKKDRLITAGIIIISVIGIIYFGFNAFIKHPQTGQNNPFEYNIEYFKQSDSALHHYREIATIDPEFGAVRAIAVGPGDRLFLAGDQAYAIYNLQRQLQTIVNCGLSVRAMAVDKNNEVYLGAEKHIEVFNEEGKQIKRWPDFSEKSLITSIAVTSSDVYIADAGNFIVLNFDKKGQLKNRIGEKDEQRQIPGFVIPSPFFDLAVDPDGFLWVVNPGRLSLENYTSEGDLRTAWGEAGMDIERFCGCCNPGHIAILDDGSFVTAEKGIARVKVYNRLGRLISVVAGPDQFTAGTVGLDLAVDSQNRIYVLDPKRKLVRIFVKKNK